MIRKFVFDQIMANSEIAANVTIIIDGYYGYLHRVLVLDDFH